MRWSNSALYVAQACGEKFRRMYIERDFRPSGIRAKRGTAAHKVANEAHMRQLRAKEASADFELNRNLILRDSLPTIEEAKDIAADSFERALVEGVAWTPEEKALGVEKVAGAEKDTAVRMGAHYVQVVAPRVDPVAVERKTVIRPADMNVEITGIVDLVSVEPPAPIAIAAPIIADALMQEPRIRTSGDEVINDLKTSDRSPREGDAARSQQLPLYALIRTAETGRMPEKLRLRTLVTTRTGKVSHVEQTTETRRENLEAVAQRLNAAISAVERGSFVPANPDWWGCSAKYCAYFGDCKFALGREKEDEG